jgi:hypothetical protein
MAKRGQDLGMKGRIQRNSMPNCNVSMWKRKLIAPVAVRLEKGEGNLDHRLTVGREQNV